MILWCPVRSLQGTNALPTLLLRSALSGIARSFRDRSFLSGPSPSAFPELLVSSRIRSVLSGSPSFTGGARVGVASPRSFPDSFRRSSSLSADRAGPLCGADVTSGRTIKGRVRAARAVRGGGRGAGGRSLRTHRPGEGMGRGAGGGRRAAFTAPRSGSPSPARTAGHRCAGEPGEAEAGPASAGVPGTSRSRSSRLRRAVLYRGAPRSRTRGLPAGLGRAARSEGRGRDASEGRADRERPQPS